VSVEEIAEAQSILPVVSVQNRCNPADVRAFREGVVARCEQEGLAFLPWSPVGGSYGKGQVGGHPALGAVARRHGVTPFQVALAWLIRQSPAMIPIPGASRAESAVSSARAADLELSDQEVAELDQEFRPA
jgi:pyridoxine 4-dehydrogenase